MAYPSSAPAGGPRAGAPYGPPMGGPGSPATRRRLTNAQRTRLRLVSGILVLVGVLGGLVATFALPHVYAARVAILYNLGDTDASAGLADTTLTTQTLLATSVNVLQPVAASSGVPLEYLQKNVSATVVANTNKGTQDDNVPNSEMIQIQVNHPDRESGINLANAVAQQYVQVANSSYDALRAQIENAQRQLANPTTPPDAATDLQTQITDMQTELAQTVTNNDLASIPGGAYTVTDPVFPNTLITLGVGAVVGILLASLVGLRMVRRWTQR
jgi:capsular polysaccharide biosynthesis protein